MSPQQARREPAPETQAEPWRLTEALNEKLAELRGRGLQLAWIECSRADLTRLIVEGGETAIRLDPDPALDLAWYDGVEIRHSPVRPLTWVFLKGEDPTGEISAHIVSPPDSHSDSHSDRDRDPGGAPDRPSDCP